MKGGYFLLNGQFRKVGDFIFNLDDLTDRVNGFSETFRAGHNEVFFQQSVCSHLLTTAATIGMDLTGLIDPEGRLLRKDVSRLLNKNRYYLAAKVQIQVYPSNNKINILLEAQEIGRGYYPVGETGLILSFFTERKKEIQPFSNFAPAGLAFRQAAEREAAELNKPNLILLNRNGFACESIGGSFAYIVGQMVCFPAESSGGYSCSIKNEIRQSVQKAGFIPVEKEEISQEELLSADEMFVFDACRGIQKVLGLEERRFYSTKTQQIAAQFTILAEQDRMEKV